MDEPTVVEIIDSRIARNGARMFTTLEGANPSGSIKDRMVHGELSALFSDGKLTPGDRVSEVSAGSTARSLAHHCREMGLICELFVPDVLPEEATADLVEMGANIHRGSREEGYALYADFCARVPNHALSQLSDETLARHYRTIGATVNERGGPIDTVIGAVGTGHSLLGAAAGVDPSPFVVTAEPAEPNAVLGIRNLELERFGPMDGCKPEMFDQRLVLEAGERRELGAVATDQGEMSIGDSFALVLAAAERLVLQRDAERVLLVGAENRL